MNFSLCSNMSGFCSDSHILELHRTHKGCPSKSHRESPKRPLDDPVCTFHKLQLLQS